MRSRLGVILVGLTLLGVPATTRAVITALTPLRNLLGDAEYVLVAKVERVLPETPAVVLTVADDLKGKAPFRRLPVNFKGDQEAAKRKQVPQLLKRLPPGRPVVLFVTRRGKIHNALAFTEGTWFSLQGRPAGASRALAWQLTHGEPYLRRTFRGTTAELRKALADALAGTGKLPEPDEKAEPGFGPETPAKQSRQGSAAGGPLFAVIPTLGVGAPLALLALLFPAVFGGVLVLFRQWAAFLTVLSLNSLPLLILPLLDWFGVTLRGTWLGWTSSDAALLLYMIAVTLLGLLWSWRRQLAQLALGPYAVEAPRKTEVTLLLVLSGACLLAVGVTIGIHAWNNPSPWPPLDAAWVFTLAISAGIWLATLYKIVRAVVGSTTPLATEGVMLAGGLAALLAIGGARWTAAAAPAAGLVEAGPALPGQAGLSAPELIGPRWTFVGTEDGKAINGVFCAAPLVVGDRVYALAAQPASIGKSGTLYCIDRTTGKELWQFIGDGELKEGISSPFLADGKLYFGEGFHGDPGCKVYCVEADTGKQVWSFQTTNQTESSPVVVNGKVFIGGGNDGFYCLDAATGKKLWLHSSKEGERLQRFGAGAAVLGNRVYVGTGVDRDLRNAGKDPGETAIFCLDAETGKPLWKTPTKLPCWGVPVVRDGRLYVPLGNGDLVQDADPSEGPPAGQVLCLDLRDGKELWRFDAPNGILERPAIDAHSLYVGCRDGQVYCLNRHDGKERWKTFMESPVITAPVLARCPGYEATAHVFAVATGGKVACLNPQTGDVYWTYNLAANRPLLSSAPRVVVSRTPDGDYRDLIFGGGPYDMQSGPPVLYCVRDVVRVK